MRNYGGETLHELLPAFSLASLAEHWRAASVTWTYRAFLLATSGIGLHLLDDAFISNAPGTHPGDHLIGCLLGVLVLLVAHAGWPWSTTAVRAVMALTLGVLASGVGLLTHGAALLGGDITFNAFTGLLLILSGFLLIGLGVVLTRQCIVHPVQRNLRWLVRRALALVAAYLVLTYLCIPVFISAHATYPRQERVEAADLGAPFEDVYFTTSDGLTLSGWFVSPRNGATILALPGASNDRTGVAEQAAMLVRHGYGVLLFDPRGMGGSEGDPNQFGWQTDKDIRAALAFLRNRPDVDPTRIGAFGLSMGGEAVLQAAAEQPEIAAVVAEGAGSRNLDETLLTPGIDKWIALPQTWLAFSLTALLSNTSPAPPLNELVARIAPRPLLLIYSSSSQQAGEAQLNPLYFAAAREPKAIWAIPDAGHTQGLATHPQEYETRVIDFFNRALLDTSD